MARPIADTPILRGEYAKLVRLDENSEIKPFESTDKELNDFLFNDAKKYAGFGFGNFMIKTVREMYTKGNQLQSGCCFITVDAYSNALEFYKKNRFNYLTDKDKTSVTRAMYFDLKAI